MFCSSKLSLPPFLIMCEKTEDRICLCLFVAFIVSLVDWICIYFLCDHRLSSHVSVVDILMHWTHYYVMGSYYFRSHLHPVQYDINGWLLVHYVDGLMRPSLKVLIDWQDVLLGASVVFVDHVVWLDSLFACMPHIPSCGITSILMRYLVLMRYPP
eukprot:212148_1